MPQEIKQNLSPKEFVLLEQSKQKKQFRSETSYTQIKDSIKEVLSNIEGNNPKHREIDYLRLKFDVVKEWINNKKKEGKIELFDKWRDWYHDRVSKFKKLEASVDSKLSLHRVTQYTFIGQSTAAEACRVTIKEYFQFVQKEIINNLSHQIVLRKDEVNQDELDLHRDWSNAHELDHHRNYGKGQHLAEYSIDSNLLLGEEIAMLEKMKSIKEKEAVLSNEKKAAYEDWKQRRMDKLRHAFDFDERSKLGGEQLSKLLETYGKFREEQLKKLEVLLKGS